jgi:hypothetical protein
MQTNKFTLNDVLEKHTGVRGVSALVGSTPEFEEQYLERFRKVGKALMEEQGITTEQEAQSLSRTTILGESSTRLYVELLEWLKTQHTAFA